MHDQKLRPCRKHSCGIVEKLVEAWSKNSRGVIKKLLCRGIAKKLTAQSQKLNYGVLYVIVAG